MPKAKLEIPSSDVGKLTNACDFVDAKLLEVKQLGSTSVAVVSARSAGTFFKIGTYLDKMDSTVSKDVAEKMSVKSLNTKTK